MGDEVIVESCGEIISRPETKWLREITEQPLNLPGCFVLLPVWFIVHADDVERCPQGLNKPLRVSLKKGVLPTL